MYALARFSNVCVRAAISRFSYPRVGRGESILGFLSVNRRMKWLVKIRKSSERRIRSVWNLLAERETQQRNLN
jgi:hypothetical protein